MNTNEVKTGDTDDDDDKQVCNEEVSSGVKTQGVLGSVVKRKTGWCRR